MSRRLSTVLGAQLGLFGSMPERYNAPSRAPAGAGVTPGPATRCDDCAGTCQDRSPGDGCTLLAGEDPALLRVGDLVDYSSPSWGAVTGEILSLDGRPGYALCQDLSQHGAREWWPVAELRRIG